VELLAAKGWAVGNVDTTVVMEAPRLRPFVDAMRTSIARMLCVDVDSVSVKATTSEGLGFVGAGEGAAAYAVCTIHRPAVPTDYARPAQ
jgi:2-C-methyl-D-erythritol 2,4-cyclodiphosphate synthase